MKKINSRFLDRLTLAVVLAATPIVAATVAAQALRPAPTFAITGMRAKLYYPLTETFSDDMLAVPGLELWNTVIGAGWAKQPSNATLVIVEIAGPNGVSYPDQLAVELSVTDSRRGRVVLRQRVDLGSSESGKRAEAFWIYDTGCVPLTLRARLVGQTRPSAVTRQLPFTCGE